LAHRLYPIWSASARKTRRHPCFLFFRVFCTLLLDLYRGVGAHPKTETARRTVSGVDFFRIGQSLIVKILGHAKVFLRAKYDTQPTTLTTVLFKVNFLHSIPYDTVFLGTFIIIRATVLRVNPIC
jgi:hypothetical protein